MGEVKPTRVQPLTTANVVLPYAEPDGNWGTGRTQRDIDNNKGWSATTAQPAAAAATAPEPTVDGDSKREQEIQKINEASARAAGDAPGAQPRVAPAATTSTTNQEIREANEALISAYNTPEPEPKFPDGVNSYYEFFLKNNPHQPESEEERKKRERREARRRLMTAVGDGISAMSNLWFTHQYAPNMYDPREAMEPKLRERYERAAIMRDKRDDDWRRGALAALENDNKRERASRDWQIQKAEALYKAAVAKAEQEHKERLRELEIKIQQGKVSLVEAQAAKGRAEAEHAAAIAAAREEKALQDAKNAKKQGENMDARTNLTRAQLKKVQKQIKLLGRTGTKGKTTYPAWDKDGKEHRFYSSSEALSFAADNGTIDYYYTETSNPLRGTTSTQHAYPSNPNKGKGTSSDSKKSSKGNHKDSPY